MGTGLADVLICLVFPYSLSHYTRLLDEIGALERAGAKLELLTSPMSANEAPRSIETTVAPLAVDEEYVATRLARSGGGLVQSLKHLGPWLRAKLTAHRNAVERRAILRAIAARVDIIWVIDEPLLPAVMHAVRGRRAAVVYETVDLVPEYRHLGERFRQRRLEEERRLVGRVDGFITAADSYADYYEQRYSGRELKRRPVVRDNMPMCIAPKIRPTTGPLRLLFMGSLMFDRPVIEIIEAMALVTADVSLTIQGKNHLGDEPARFIRKLGLEGRVSVVEPCPPGNTVEVAHGFDVGIVALRGADENERRASTSKLFTYMAAGLAVLGSDLPGIARVVNEHRNGVLVMGIDPQGWADAIEGMAALPPAHIDAMKRRSLVAAKRHSWERQKDTFVAEFERALGR